MFQNQHQNALGDRKSYSVRLLPELMKKLKFLAVKKEQKISSLLEEAIQDLLKKYKAN